MQEHSRPQIGNANCQYQKKRRKDSSFDRSSSSLTSEKTAKYPDHVCLLIKIWGRDSGNSRCCAANSMTGQTTVRKLWSTIDIKILCNYTYASIKRPYPLCAELLPREVNQPREISSSI